jgi:hypothetical protein
MVNIDLKFIGLNDNNGRYRNWLRVETAFYEDEKAICIEINEIEEINTLYLNKATAVRLVRELKKQIGLLDLEGGKDGRG